MLAEYFGVVFVGGALFPRVAYWLRWPTRLGPRWFVAYVAFTTLWMFAVRNWLMPLMQRSVAKVDRVTASLREELGRDPTQDEITARFMAEYDG